MFALQPQPRIRSVAANRLDDAQIQGVNQVPGNPFTVDMIPLNYDTEDIEQILSTLNGLVTSYAVSPWLRQHTIDALGNNVRNGDLGGIAWTLLQFVRNRMRYVPDPIDGEWICSPITLLDQIEKNGVAYGDCDDHCLLYASMLGSVGIHARIIGVMLNSTEWFDHVIVRVILNGRTQDVDPCYKEGSDAPDYYHKMI